jgi:hypothetical protein
VLNWLKRSWKPLLGLLSAVVLAYSALAWTGHTPSAEVCSKGEYGPPDQCASYDIVTAFLRRLFVFLDEHNGLVAAFAGVVVAFFTGVLWNATVKLWSEARQQRQDFRKGGLAGVIAARAALRSSRAAEKSANTAERALHNLEGPLIRPDRMGFRHDESSGTISFGFRNYGRSPSVVRGVSAIFPPTPLLRFSIT